MEAVLDHTLKENGIRMLCAMGRRPTLMSAKDTERGV